MQPPANRRFRGQRAGVARQFHEHSLRDVLRAMDVAIDQSQRRRMHHPDVEFHQFVKSILRTFFSVIGEQLSVRCHSFHH